MSFRYNSFQKFAKKIYRKFNPVPKSPWTEGYVKDICEVNLVPPEDLVNFFERCIKILQEKRGKKIGDYLEFGVFNGSSLSSMYFAAKKMELKSMKFFGFDAFEGLSEWAEKEDGGVWKKGFYSCSFEKMKERLKRKNIDSSEIQFVKGWYEDTLNNETTRKFKIKDLGIVFIDCDTYGSSKEVLDFVGPLIKEECILCFDDWKLNDLDIKGMGEYRSFNEFLEKNKDLSVEEIKSYNRKSKCFLVRRNK